MALLSVEEALVRVTDRLGPLPAEHVCLKEADGRVLADAVQAHLTQPPFNASAMDGYAVRGADLARLPATFTLAGEAAAGAAFGGSVRPGEAVRIFTGAPVPDGADTVVVQENTEVSDRAVTIREGEPGRHIRPFGQDFQKGEILLGAGTRLGPRALMLAAAGNNAHLSVRRKPVVAILATGDELVPPGFEPSAAQVISSIPCGLSALVRQAGAEPLTLGIAEDTPDSLASLIRSGREADILVTIGGASVGGRDLVRQVLADEGLELDFWKIAMRPGKPMLYGRMGEQRVLGLPGNPISAMVCAMVFLRPMIAGLLGMRDSGASLQRAVLAEPLEANGPRQHYMRALSHRGEDGERLVSLLPSQDSALMAAFAKADCLIVRPPYAPAVKPGAVVRVMPLEG